MQMTAAAGGAGVEQAIHVLAPFHKNDSARTEEGERRRAATEALPEKTLGILVRKLFTVRMGMPFFSSCMRAITSSIWRGQGEGRKREKSELFFFFRHRLA